MKSLQIHEDRSGYSAILYLLGNLTKDTLFSLEANLKSLIHERKPEIVILQCAKLTQIDQGAVAVLQNFASIFEEQKRKLVLCNIDESLITAALKSSPFGYYSTQQQALQESAQDFLPHLSSSLLTKQKPVLKLTILAGKSKGAVCHRSKGELVVGRHSKCDLALPHDVQVSRFHCRCYENNGKFFLEDLKSCNGTLFGGNLIEEVELSDGNRFQVGEAVIQAEILNQNITNTAAIALPFPKLDMSEVAENACEQLPEFESPPLVMSEDNIATAAPSPIRSLLENSDLLSEVQFLNSACVPMPITRTELKIQIGDLVTERYQVEKILGETNTSLWLYCCDLEEEANVYLQYTKEAMKIPVVTQCHPQILLPSIQGKFNNRIFRVFPNSYRLFNRNLLAEIQILEVGIMMCDILSALHEIGIKGIDISASCILYQQRKCPMFVIMPINAYSGSAAQTRLDSFALGALLFELISGQQNLPYTPLGMLEGEKILQYLETVVISPLFARLLLQIFSGRVYKLEDIGKRLEKVLMQILTPKTSSKKIFSLQLIKVGDAVIYTSKTNKMDKFPFRDDIAAMVREELASDLSIQKLTALGEKIYSGFFPEAMRRTLDKIITQRLLISLDKHLGEIPWELAHDGEQFLALRYCLSRELSQIPLTIQPEIVPLTEPRILIISDRDCGNHQLPADLIQGIVEQCPQAKVKCCNVDDNPFAIVKQISHSDIVHIIAESEYNEQSPLSSYWLLANGYKLKIRFLENAPRKPKILFYQPQNTLNFSVDKFLALLYQTGIETSISTWWPVNTAKCSLIFYKYIFQGLSADYAVYEARRELLADSKNEALAMLLYGYPGGPVATEKI